jgi:hypothetical protein
MRGMGRVDVEVAACFSLGMLSERGPCLSSSSQSRSSESAGRAEAR